MSLFIAHFLTLYLESMSDSDTPSADEVISSATVRGIITSESVSGVSYSQDVSTITNDLDGLSGNLLNMGFNLHLLLNSWVKVVCWYGKHDKSKT